MFDFIFKCRHPMAFRVSPSTYLVCLRRASKPLEKLLSNEVLQNEILLLLMNAERSQTIHNN